MPTNFKAGVGEDGREIDGGGRCREKGPEGPVGEALRYARGSPLAFTRMVCPGRVAIWTW